MPTATVKKPKKITKPAEPATLPDPADDPDVLAAREKRSELVEQRAKLQSEADALASELSDERADYRRRRGGAGHHRELAA